MAKAADWLREERRKVLGDWVAFCLGCGAARRWFEEFEAEVPDTCPQCGGELLRRCQACGAPFSSIAVVDCEQMRQPVRPNELFGSEDPSCSRRSALPSREGRGLRLCDFPIFVAHCRRGRERADRSIVRRTGGFILLRSTGRFVPHSFVLAAAAAVAAVALIAPAGASAVVGNCTPDAAWGAPDASFAAQVVTLVNQHRQAMGLSTLGVSPTLTASAQWKSAHMAYYQYMQHDDPAPPVTRTVSDRLAACGYPIGNVGWGENIAYGYRRRRT